MTWVIIVMVLLVIVVVGVGLAIYNGLIGSGTGSRTPGRRSTSSSSGATT